MYKPHMASIELDSLSIYPSPSFVKNHFNHTELYEKLFSEHLSDLHDWRNDITVFHKARAAVLSLSFEATRVSVSASAHVWNLPVARSTIRFICAYSNGYQYKATCGFPLLCGLGIVYSGKCTPRSVHFVSSSLSIPGLFLFEFISIPACVIVGFTLRDLSKPCYVSRHLCTAHVNSKRQMRDLPPCSVCDTSTLRSL